MTKYLMQAADPDGVLRTWLADSPDWTADFAPVLHDGVYTDITVAGGGIDNGAGSGSSVPALAITLTDGSYVTLDDGSYATTTS